MKFIPLRLSSDKIEHDGIFIWVNCNHIINFLKSGDGSCISTTMDVIQVKDSPKEILALIAELEKVEEPLEKAKWIGEDIQECLDHVKENRGKF